MPERRRVAYVAGVGRSGSTLLDLMLGRLPGVVSVGELTHLWSRGAKEDQLCGCGEPFSRCPFWSAVMEEAFGDAPPDADEMSERRGRVCSFWRISRLARVGPGGLQDEAAAYAGVVGRLYRAIQAVSGCDLVVDSSKYPPEAHLLRAMGDVDLSLLHIVRDPNAVAYSWQRRKVLPEVHWEKRYYARYPFPKTAVAWEAFNRVLRRLGRRVPYRVVRYEDLVEQPGSTLTDVAEFLGLPAPELDFLDGTELTLGTNHTVSGNSLRFENGPIELALDDAWRGETSAFQRTIVKLLTAPGRGRYGYR